MAGVRFGKILPLAGVIALLAPMATQGDSLSVLRFFSDGCGVTAPESVTFCKGGLKAGDPCTPRPEFDPSFPSFSLDCCADLNQCFTNDPDAQCGEATRSRCGVPSFCEDSGDPCASSAECEPADGTQLAEACVSEPGPPAPCLVDSDCDSFLCVAGDPNTLGEPCTTNAQCADPFFPEEAECAGAKSACTLDLSQSVMGTVLKVNDNVGLVAVVTGTSIIPQPTNNKRDRLQVDVDFQLFDLDELVFVDPSLCTLPIRFGLQIRPTEGVLDSTVDP